MKSSRLACGIVAVCGLVAIPAPSAASVAGRGTVDSFVLIYAADPGEANRLTVSRAGNRVVFDDPAATIAPQYGCVALSRNRVSCEHNRDELVLVELEDADDRATTSGDVAGAGISAIHLEGDQGDDTLRGTTDPMSLNGGSGHDVLAGGPATSHIDAVNMITRFIAPGVVPPFEPERDEVSCTASSDGGRPTGIRADSEDTLSGSCGPVSTFSEDGVTTRGTDGPDTIYAGAFPSRIVGLGGDDFISIGQHDRADGGPGDDRLFGPGLLLGADGNDRLDTGLHTGADGRLAGEGGDDFLTGAEGDDRISGGPGRDRISGRGGADRIRARDGERDVVRCGKGRDRVIADREDVVARDCERASPAAAGHPRDEASAAARRGCRASRSRGAKVVTRTKEAVVFTKRFGVYGCLFSADRVRPLPDEGGGIHAVKLAGRFAAYATFGSAIGDEFDRVYVYDLRRGRRKFVESSTFVTELVAKRNGSVAWIQVAVVAPGAGQARLLEVRKVAADDQEGNVLLDRGSAIDSDSLTLSDDRQAVSWTDAGETRSAPLR